ncbi:protein WEAK CHLOROPLAST MOVEMENT UNDER BLUE LIGHT 1-like [Cucurbita moschata]|uniref:Protein WEAK CHLOROPLAST MOVEMENT UNDER BLUE LIGHT 1-like n=1 Tax=Cucurbita moschata TaxID=3662 RepID=A0A6J1GI85_CUCMO|nr:protein WEAK CHLOROPLAST MOVEMENT UNDER BLUE LIGHT 1-like [Cucurbita moschata]XP_022951250.1 protein WEAK CHLOROPLAST MOVEMENT UNDER BLUE LIGHT 1-like [Cucurbita moschata]
MTGSESEAPTVIACNGDIDFESGSLTDPVAKGEKHSENPEFFAAKDPPVIVGNRHKISGKDNNVAMEVHSPRTSNQGGLNRGFIETKAPIVSVKAAVSKFGGIVDWKARRVYSMVERSKTMEDKLEDVQEEILQLRKRSEKAMEAEFGVLKELENTKRRIEELTLEVGIAQTEEQRAKQDSELAKLRLEEMEKGTADENDDALAKAQLEMAMAGHAAAVSELKSIKEELEVLRDEFSSLVSERDLAVRNADDALAAAKDGEKALQELVTELVALKESMKSAQAAHLEAEEQRMVAEVAKELDCSKWKKELDDAEEEFSRLKSKVQSIEDLKLKVNTASTLLSNLKVEMVNYMESVIKEEEISDEQLLKGEVAETENKESAVHSTKKELEEVKLNIEKAIAEVEYLKMAATSLKSELEEERSSMETTKKREGRHSDEAASLEAELDKNMSEIIVVQGNEREARGNSVDLTNQLKQAAVEADQAKTVAKTARDDLQKAKMEVEQTKAESIAMKRRIVAAQKEIEASNASKMLALSAIKALQESDSSETAKEDSSTTVTISLEEYNELSERARKAEEHASFKMTEAISQIEAAKESEAKCQEMLEEVSRELVARQEGLKAATEKASEAKEGKLAVEQDLRLWRAKQEQKRKDNKANQQVAIPTTNQTRSVEAKESRTDKQADSPAPQQPISKEQTPKSLVRAESLEKPKEGKKKKRSFFPRILRLLGKHKSSGKKAT